MSKILPKLAILVVLVGVGMWLSQTKNAKNDGDLPKATASATDTAKNVKEFAVTGTNFSFDPPTITVKKGDKIKIILKNSGGFHDLKIDELHIATKKIRDGGEDSVEFITDKVGSFEYYCSVGEHRAMGMKGTLIVGE